MNSLPWPLTVICALQLVEDVPARAFFIAQVTLSLWVTLLFASLGVAAVEARTLARAGRLRVLQSDIPAKSLILPDERAANWLFEIVRSQRLKVGEVILVKAGEVIPADGEVLEGVASVDELAVTGELAPVIRESGGDRSAVIGGTRVLSDWLKIKVTAKVGNSFFDQIIRLIVDTRRRTSQLERAVTAPLLVCALLSAGFAAFIDPFPATSTGLDLTALLIALLTALLPTATVGLLCATGVAGINRLLAANVVAKSAAAVEAAATVDTLLLDKTGTITMGGSQCRGDRAPARV